jgi:hypothetical protein
MGNHKVEFNASNLTSGVYFYKLKYAGFTETRKLILLRWSAEFTYFFIAGCIGLMAISIVRDSNLLNIVLILRVLKQR